MHQDWIAENGTLMIYAGKAREFTIPEGIHTIGEGAFRGCASLTRIIIPPEVTTIEPFAFNRCAQLKSVLIPDSVTAIGKAVFFGCGSLEELRVPPEWVEKKGIAGVKMLFGSRVLQDDHRLDPLIRGILEGRASLNTALHDRLISWLKGRKNHRLWALRLIREDEPQLLQNLMSLRAKPVLEEVDLYLSWASELQSPAVLAFLLEYKKAAFSPEFLEKAAETALEKELGLAERTVTDWRKIFRFTFRDGNAYITGYRGKEPAVSIPARIGKHKVAGFSISGSSVEEVWLEDGITEVSSNAFAHCACLRRVALPEGVTEIGNSAFSYCQSLQEITLPGSVRRIGDHSFSFCTGLTDMPLPEQLTRIGKAAFQGCVQLHFSPFLSNLPEIAPGAFRGCATLAQENGMIIVGDVLHGYQGTHPGVALPPHIRIIAPYAFAGNTTLEEITLPSGLREIGERAFKSCTSLREIRIPNGVEFLGERAFFGCQALEQVTIPGSVEEILPWTFALCRKLRSITLPQGVRSVGERAFTYCSSLKTAALPSGLVSVGKNAFENCSQLGPISISSGTQVGENAFRGCDQMRRIPPADAHQTAL